ncbi:MAG: hypothetical protein HQM12_19130 [SAR324 cluster bacterium]|nr:hypothetical protein [SAR324 cluster bacterium]
MSASETQSKHHRSVAQLIRTTSVSNMDQYLNRLQAEINKWKEYFRQQQEKYFAETNDSNTVQVQELSAVRRFLTQFMERKLEEVRLLDVPQQEEAVRFILPFNSEGGIRDFLLHFFQLGIHDGKMDYVERDPYDKEAHILYDIYKIKKTMECIDVMFRTLRDPQKQFPSRFSEDEKEKILLELREVLKVLYRYTVKSEYQKFLYPKLTVDFVSPEKILERREQQLFYCFPHVIEKYDYRNLFFLIYFRNGLSSKVHDAAKVFHYNYYNFEILKQEYLMNWLESQLKNNPAKEKIYNTYEVDGKTITAWIAEDPSKEIELLQKLPINKFNNLIEEVNHDVDDKLKVNMPSMSEKSGELAHFKQESKKAVKYTRSPLAMLKNLFAKKETPPPKPVVAAPEPEPEPDPEPELHITFMNAKQVPFFYLCQSASGYTGRLRLIQLKMGNDFKRLDSIVTRAMKMFGENSVVRRRTPKHDWTLPYLIQYVLPAYSKDYLFIVGGEAKVKSKGMGYSSGDEYVFSPYCVFATAEQDERYGAVIEQRSVMGRTFYEYDIKNSEVLKKISEFLILVENKEFSKKS